MKKKMLLTAIIIAMVPLYCMANEQKVPAGEAVQTEIEKPQKHDFNRPPKGEFKHNENFHKHHPSKAEMEKKKAEFEKRLKLTEEQKQKIEENRKLDHEKIKPIFEQKKAKLHEIKQISNDNNINPEDKQQKIEQIQSEIKELNKQANKYREENMKAFENLLTDKQKKEFNKIKSEQKKEMEKRKAEFEKNIEKAKKEKKQATVISPSSPIEK